MKFKICVITKFQNGGGVGGGGGEGSVRDKTANQKPRSY